MVTREPTAKKAGVSGMVGYIPRIQIAERATMQARRRLAKVIYIA